MATKRELKDRASALAAKLGVDVQTDRLNHEGLTALVADLEAKLASGGAPEPEAAPPAPVVLDAAPETEKAPEASLSAPEPSVLPAADAVLALRAAAEQAAATAATAAAVSASPPKRPIGGKYVVAPGRTLFCARAGGAGLREGAPIRDTDFDAKRLAQLLEAGSIVKA